MCDSGICIKYTEAVRLIYNKKINIKIFTLLNNFFNIIIIISIIRKFKFINMTEATNVLFNIYVTLFEC